MCANAARCAATVCAYRVLVTAASDNGGVQSRCRSTAALTANASTAQRTPAAMVNARACGIARVRQARTRAAPLQFRPRHHVCYGMAATACKHPATTLRRTNVCSKRSAMQHTKLAPPPHMPPRHSTSGLCALSLARALGGCTDMCARKCGCVVVWSLSRAPPRTLSYRSTATTAARGGAACPVVNFTSTSTLHERQDSS